MPSNITDGLSVLLARKFEAAEKFLIEEMGCHKVHTNRLEDNSEDYIALTGYSDGCQIKLVLTQELK